MIMQLIKIHHSLIMNEWSLFSLYTKYNIVFITVNDKIDNCSTSFVPPYLQLFAIVSVKNTST